jgi:hypothetical protein
MFSPHFNSRFLLKLKIFSSFNKMAIYNLFTIFLLCLGVCLVIIGLFGMYFTQKLQEQNHKIKSMFEIVTSMANELGYVKSKVSLTPVVYEGGSPSFQHEKNIRTSINVIQNDENTNLIQVSDDDDSDDDDSDDDDNDDSDDDDNDDNDNDDNDDDDNDDNDDDESVYDNSEVHNNDEEHDQNDDVDENKQYSHSDVNLTIKVVNIGESMNTKNNKESNNVESNNVESNNVEVIKEENTEYLLNLKSINIDDFDDNHLEQEQEQEQDSLNVDNNDEEHHNDEKEYSSNDLKKMNLNKLKDIVLKKKLATDVSKLKKNDLLKILGVE